RRAAQWSPWLADGAEPRFSGPPAGEGAAFAWNGERPGSRRVTALERGVRLDAALRLRGGTGTSRFELQRAADGTRVRWRVELDFGNDLRARWGALFGRRALEASLESGLAALTT